MKIRSGSTGSSFTLQFLTDTAEHAVNSTLMVVAPYVELGREKGCGVYFGEDAGTVSRKHAALERKGQNVFIRNLSATNQTLVNGRPVHREWLLHNGDEIQLSAEGPRMRFVQALDNPALRFTSRIKLFAEQAVRPYRLVLLALLLIFLVGAVAVGIQFAKVRSGQARLIAVAQSVSGQMEEQQKAMAAGNSVLIAEKARRAEELAQLNKQNQEFQEALVKQSRVIKALVKSATAEQPRRAVRVPAAIRKPNPEAIIVGSTQAQVYAVRIFLTVRDNAGQPLDLAAGSSKSVRLEDYFMGTGTGFVLEDGRFVTSRRWVKPWAYPEGEKDMLALFANFVHHNGGNAVVKLIATAPGGPELTFTDHQFSSDSTHDQPVIGNFGFGEGKIMVANPENGGDWAVTKVPMTGLASAPEIMPGSGAQVHLLGYEIPVGAQDGPTGVPTYTKRIVAGTGTAKGMLLLRGSSFERSTYGGPAYVVKEGKPMVVGLLAGGEDGKGMIIPISQIGDKE